MPGQLGYDLPDRAGHGSRASWLRRARSCSPNVLANNPGSATPTRPTLIGPATRNGQDYGYTLLGLISNTLAQYHTWTNAPLEQMTDASAAHVLAEQAAWASSQANNPARGDRRPIRPGRSP